MRHAALNFLHKQVGSSRSNTPGCVRRCPARQRCPAVDCPACRVWRIAHRYRLSGRHPQASSPKTIESGLWRVLKKEPQGRKNRPSIDRPNPQEFRRPGRSTTGCAQRRRRRHQFPGAVNSRAYVWNAQQSPACPAPARSPRPDRWFRWRCAAAATPKASSDHCSAPGRLPDPVPGSAAAY